MAKLAVHGPLDERDLHDDLGPRPSAPAGAAGPRLGERRLRRPRSRRAARADRAAASCRSPVPTLPAKTKSSPVVVADEQRAEAYPLPCGSVKPPTTKSWSPRTSSSASAATGGVRSASPGAWRSRLPSLRAPRAPTGCGRRAAPRAPRRSERQRVEQRAALIERQRRHVASVEPHDVEHVIRARADPR